MNAYQFFLRHAGYSYDPKTQTRMQGRIKCAQSLARAERTACDAGFSHEWETDRVSNSSEFRDDVPPYSLWCCVARDSKGAIVATLGGIDFGPDGSPWGDPYRRVVEAELSSEGLAS